MSPNFDVNWVRCGVAPQRHGATVRGSVSAKRQFDRSAGDGHPHAHQAGKAGPICASL